MSESTKQLLDELYELDPGLKEHEAELLTIITELIKHKPHVAIDAAFAQSLRRKLMAKATIMTDNAPTAHRSWFSVFKLGISAVALVAITIAGTRYFDLAQNSLTAKDAISLLSGTESISEAPSRAFGSLNMQQQAYGGIGGGGDAQGSAAPATEVARPQSGGGGDTATTDQKMIAPDIYQPTTYKFVYTGDPLAAPASELPVYARQRNIGASDALIKSLKLGVLNLDKFTNKKLDSVNIVEDRDWGYNIRADFTNGTVYIDQNWAKWPLPDRTCQTADCYEALRIKPEQIPSDEALIATANQFLKDYGISTAGYGTPVISQTWRTDIAAAPNPSDVYIPDTQMVTYPLMVDGQMVLAEDGQPSGLSVMINVRVNKVSGVADIASRTFQKSNYTTETDTTRLLNTALQGDWRGDFSDPNGTQLTVELGTPKTGYVRMWVAKPNGLESQELFIPALFFPVTKQPQGQPAYWRSTVVVPLIKEVLDTANQNPPVMPLERAAE
jgi:hypothetical protein